MPSSLAVITAVAAGLQNVVLSGFFWTAQKPPSLALVEIAWSALRVEHALPLAGRPRASLFRQAYGTTKLSPASFLVRVPQTDAELHIDGGPAEDMFSTGVSREFESVPLEFGPTYEYEFSATWQPNDYTTMTRRRTIQFKAGDRVIVDLTSADPSDRAEIRYVPTPRGVTRAMITLAKIGTDDVVYEPGCGDARVTIAAVLAGAKKGVGVDIDPQRVAEARASVKSAGLDNQVGIRLGDALDIEDLSEATVVFLYMGDEFNMLMRPILWSQLKVGARVVSHRFTMGDWEPEETVHVVDRETKAEYDVHLWTITKAIKEEAVGRGVRRWHEMPDEIEPGLVGVPVWPTFLAIRGFGTVWNEVGA